MDEAFLGGAPEFEFDLPDKLFCTFGGRRDRAVSSLRESKGCGQAHLARPKRL